ncbi:Fe-S cluster assembly protein SufD [Pseudolysinimonas sp.]|uniref:Fe-S cluster assembly protein SufD n=1 Tax=Pseudolysinimonas sp. TaxID=2680009 RepID=UPI00286B2BBF|nr:Fe-S cluster assembly protein SufD [Pseudolysinimonas sp.]
MAAATEAAERLGIVAHTDGPVIPVQTRSERFTSTEHAAFPPVEGWEAEWKLTPVAKIRDLIDGELDGLPYPIQYPDVAGTTVEWIDRDDARIGSAGIPEERAAANGWTSFEKALRIAIEGEPDALTVTRAAMGSAPRAAHVLVEAAPQSKGVVVLDSRGSAAVSENVEIVVGESADLTLVSLQEWDDDARHLASHFATIGKDAKLTHIVVSLGGAIVRVNPSAHLAGEGSDAELLGVYFADAGQHLEQRVYVHHDAPHTRSRVTYKGALNGEGARTVWVGDVLIGPRAVGTDTYEQNRNLVLSEGTRADSIPNLEIQTGDIVGAGHASATGRFDDEHLFYLQSRGIPEAEARRLVVLGFLIEVVQRIPEPVLQARLIAALVAELEGAA